MPWTLTDKGRRVEPIAGVPWRDMSDAEFAEAERLLDQQFPGQPKSLRKSGFFAQLKEKERDNAGE